MYNNVLTCFLLLSVVDRVFGGACSNGAVSAGPCIKNVCPSGYECLSSVCCEQMLHANENDVQADDADTTTASTPTTPTTPTTPFNPFCVDGAINCGMFVAYCFSDQYLECMVNHCARTCEYCNPGR
ncbi:unnamed protein product [Bursaphelenchus okinawaensis]|uniref:ShKT domain-containing protein n=1 Tax=Bursaphelenchus okinawaensis TaxID=465554 RepID=A0A811KY84_9BILA|nr:unnamed protein product [Bursaphelenchus okinawaensis]CAG9114462.1 unnamed protein product [Bursaphelenchus okinawaensis]